MVGDPADGVVYRTEGGNDGGHIEVTDGRTGQYIYWVAPEKFRGDQASFYGGSLRFDYRQSALDNQVTNAPPEDVILEGGGWRLTYDIPGNPGTTWTSIVVPLDARAGWLDGDTKAPPSEAKMRAALANITRLQLRAEYRRGIDTNGLDNVAYSRDSVLDDGPPVSTFDATNEGWRATADVLTYAYVVDEDKAGGYLRVYDLNSGQAIFWSAPPKFLGDQARFYGGVLTYSIRQSTLDNQAVTEDDVYLTGGDLELVYDVADNPGLDWSQQSIPLTEAAGWTKTGDGTAPSASEFTAVLSDLRRVSIRAEYSRAAEFDDLDNVAFSTAQGTARAEVPHPLSALSAVYPSPLRARGRVALTLDRSQRIRLALYDMLGREAQTIYEGTLPPTETIFEIDGAGLSSGVYFLRVTGESVHEVRTLTILK